jgi:uncharacterized protein YecE (DUF72 family)
MNDTGRLRIGTASWTDRTLVRESDWYPRRSMSAEERLRFYASIFTMVEVDATYYHPPTPQLAGLWAERTPQDFRFDVKAFALLTNHPTRADAVWETVVTDLPTEHASKDRVYLNQLPEPARERAFAAFADALRPLESAGKLGAVFFQLPPWFTNSRPNRRFLDSLPGRVPFPTAVEFRHRSWMDGDSAAKTLGQLERLGLAYVCVDAPQGFDSSMPPVLAVTADLAVVRFHGRNRETWEAKGISPAERFRYLYTDEELADWAPRVRDLATQARETHVVFNNCYRDYGVRNAQDMKQLLNS